MNALELGVQVHKTLEKIICSDNWQTVKASLDSSLRFSEIDRDKIISRVEGVMELDGVQQFFQPNIHVEVEVDFVDKLGKVLRPDRIVRIDDTWHVIDYKSTISGSVSHEKQVREYVHLLEEIEKAEVKGWLIYTDPSALKNVL